MIKCEKGKRWRGLLKTDTLGEVAQWKECARLESEKHEFKSSLTHLKAV